MEVLRVASKTEAKAVANAIASIMSKGHAKLEMESIGAGALNEAVKGVIIARGMLTTQGIELKVIPSFINKEVDGILKTGIKLLVTSE